MAELEVIKHTKKVYQIFRGEHSMFNKIKEFLLEILIIIFAVSITIWFHDIAEHRHHQHEVHEFLSGLKNDLKNDLTEMQSDRAGYKYQESAFRYFSRINPDAPGTADSLAKYTNAIFNKVELMQNNGRFEGFKSSGKLGNIENKELQNDILDLYQELIPSLLNTTRLYNTQKDRFIIYVEQNTRIDTEKKALLLGESLKTDHARIMSHTLTGFPAEVLKRYDLCIASVNSIIKQIEAQEEE